MTRDTLVPDDPGSQGLAAAAAGATPATADEFSKKKILRAAPTGKILHRPTS